MPNFLIAAAVAIGALWLIRTFARANPSQINALGRKAAGGACIALAGFLALRGMIEAAMALAVFGLGLVGSNMLPGGFPWSRKTPGQRSRVATALLVMELDHDTGRMDGEILSGPAKGRKLSSLSDSELKAFRGVCLKTADQSLALLDAWLDRHRDNWRAAWGQPGGAPHPPGASGSMTKEEALAVLGLKPGAGEADIRAAHRRLMKDFHPDKGGSDYLAAKINQAKDTLLGA